ncbi:hypothetical protein FRC06_006027, partial [Ceratobasidium sp. 370]
MFTLKLGFMTQDAAKKVYEEALTRVQQIEQSKSVLNKYGKYGSAFTTLLALGSALSELDPTGGAKVAFSVCTKAWEVCYMGSTVLQRVDAHRDDEQHLEKQEKQDADIDNFVDQLARMTPTIKSVQDIADANLEDT